MKVRPLVILGAQIGIIIVPSRLTSTETAAGQAESELSLCPLQQKTKFHHIL